MPTQSTSIQEVITDLFFHSVFSFLSDFENMTKNLDSEQNHHKRVLGSSMSLLNKIHIFHTLTSRQFRSANAIKLYTKGFEQVAQKKHKCSLRVRVIIIKIKDRMQSSKHKKRYSKISVDKRMRLVGLVLDEGVSITKAAKMLHIKRPTAKIIIKRYQSSGTFFHKKMPPIRPKNDTSKMENTKVEDHSAERMYQENLVSACAKIQKMDAQTPETIAMPLPQCPFGFFWLYQPFFDYHSFM